MSDEALPLELRALGEAIGSEVKGALEYRHFSEYVLSLFPRSRFLRANRPAR
jgi:hypothetical protein